MTENLASLRSIQEFEPASSDLNKIASGLRNRREVPKFWNLRIVNAIQHQEPCYSLIKFE